jgi:DNA-binding MarR family transcriptional regulator
MTSHAPSRPEAKGGANANANANANAKRPRVAPPDVRWLDADELIAWKRLVAVIELVPSVLDAQLRRDSGLTHFDYLVLAMLSEAPDRTLRMTGLAQLTNATLTRLSHVVRRLEDRGLVSRFPCRDDGRATNARLTDDGLAALTDAAPGHVATVRASVFDALTHGQVAELSQIADALLRRLRPDAAVGAPSPRRPDRGSTPGATPGAADGQAPLPRAVPAATSASAPQAF